MKLTVMEKLISMIGLTLKNLNMKNLINISDIDINRIEGRYLMAALVKITTESQTDKTPDQVLKQCEVLQEEMYKDATDPPIDTRPQTFELELQKLINKHGRESGSDTPDFVLANYLIGCLEVFNQSVKDRDKYFETEI